MPSSTRRFGLLGKKEKSPEEKLLQEEEKMLQELEQRLTAQKQKLNNFSTENKEFLNKEGHGGYKRPIDRALLEADTKISNVASAIRFKSMDPAQLQNKEKALSLHMQKEKRREREDKGAFRERLTRDMSANYQKLVADAVKWLEETEKTMSRVKSAEANSFEGVKNALTKEGVQLSGPEANTVLANAVKTAFAAGEFYGKAEQLDAFIVAAKSAGDNTPQAKAVLETVIERLKEMGGTDPEQSVRPRGP